MNGKLSSDFPPLFCVFSSSLQRSQDDWLFNTHQSLPLLGRRLGHPLAFTREERPGSLAAVSRNRVYARPSWQGILGFFVHIAIHGVIEKSTKIYSRTFSSWIMIASIVTKRPMQKAMLRYVFEVKFLYTPERNSHLHIIPQLFEDGPEVHNFNLKFYTHI